VRSSMFLEQDGLSGYTRFRWRPIDALIDADIRSTEQAARLSVRSKLTAVAKADMDSQRQICSERRS
jgi:hypothetical protein